MPCDSRPCVHDGRAPFTLRGLIALLFLLLVSFGSIGMCLGWIASCMLAVYLSLREGMYAWFTAFPTEATVYLSPSASKPPSVWGKLMYVLDEEVTGEVLFLWSTTVVLVITLALTLRYGLRSKVPQLGRRGYRLNRRAKTPTATFVEMYEIPGTDSPKSSIRDRAISWLFRSMGRGFITYHDHYVVFEGEEELSRIHGVDSLEDIIQRVYFPTDRNYVFGYHPHGCLGSGFWSTFQMHYFPTAEELADKEEPLTGGTYFTAKRRHPMSPMRRFLHKYVVHGADIENHDFPEGTRKFALTGHTLFSNFIVPVWREYVLFSGFRDVSKGALLNNLTPIENSDFKARMCALVPGGAVESLDCTDPGKLAIKTRKGFVKLCVQTGSSVVPVYTFGETEVWSDLLPDFLISHGSLRRAQRRLQKVLTFALPLVRGRWGLPIPKNQRLTTVIGKPITCVAMLPSDPNFTQEVNRVHDAYIAGLSDIYKRFVLVFDPTCPHKEIRV